MKKTILVTASLAAAAVVVGSQQSDLLIKLTQGERAAIAVPDFRGAGAAAPLMSVLNGTLFSELQQSGLFRMVPKSLYPLEVPQRPQDFVPPGPPPSRGGAPVRRGPWLTDWSQPPASANYLTIGYAAEQSGRLVLFGWLFNVNQTDLANAQVFGKLYFGDLNEDGARKVAREFAADILGQFGFRSLIGTKIYFVSDRTGHKEIWEMDYDGANQRQITHYRSTSTFPAVSPDRTLLAFTTYAGGYPMIYIHSLETGRRLPFYNQKASMNATAEFTPDGRQIVFSSTAAGRYAQIYIADLDGSNLRRLTFSNAIDVEPTVNPKTGAEIVFVSGRSGMPQIYKMNMDGADVVRLTDGSGRNENPSWAPDGRHLVFASNRSGSMQIYTMLANGTQIKPLTTQGNNEKPVWSN